MRSIQSGTLLLVAILGAACGNSPIKRGGIDVPGVLSYAQVESLQVGMPAREVIHEFGPPANQLKQGEKVVALAYGAESAGGQAQELRIALDEQLRVARWTLAPRDKAKPKASPKAE